jgi:type II secretory pathway component PulF
MPNITLKEIVDGYFTTYGRTPKKSYDEGTIYTVIANGMAVLAGLLNGGSDINDFYLYINNQANDYGVDVNEAIQYMNAHPEYMTYIETTAKNSGYYDNSVAAVFSTLGRGIGQSISNLFWGILKPILWVVVGAIVVILAITYGPKLIKKK